MQYLKIDQHNECIDVLPQANWLLLLIANEVQSPLFSSLTTICMAHEPSYICCVGQSASILEDWFDGEIVETALAWEEKLQGKFNYDLAPITTADTSLDEGFWFATSVAPASNAAIETIFCLDLTKLKSYGKLLRQTRMLKLFFQ